MEEKKPARGGSAPRYGAGGKSDWNWNYFLFFLSKIPGLSPHRLSNLLNEHPDLYALYQKTTSPDETDNKKINLIARYLADNIFVRRCQGEFAQIQDKYLTIVDELYPPLLKNIFDPPPLLYYRGNPAILQEGHCLTIVGSRTLTTYHQTMLRQIVSHLAQTPLIIVSGLAYGIDALSHRAALENKLATVAVLGSGLADADIYPCEHRGLAREIINSGGLLLSEYPSGSAVMPYNFPLRNRLLAGLSRATLVISGAKKSGTLITAQVALEEGREVLALPGQANMNLCWGPNNLIKNGAALISDGEDILKIFNLNKTRIDQAEPNLTDSLEIKLFKKIKLEPLSSEELSRQLELTLPAVQSILGQLELKNLIKVNLYNQWEIS
ncbi:MAG: DNA-protecting protein DprA [Parcubacteria group bacterium]|nr:MAG: DNA-protecting protein DprA [Parcubacteria group bacterium]